MAAISSTNYGRVNNRLSAKILQNFVPKYAFVLFDGLRIRQFDNIRENIDDCAQEQMNNGICSAFRNSKMFHSSARFSSSEYD